MASIKEPGIGLNYKWALGENGWNVGMDENLVKLGAVVQLVAQAISNTPQTDADGSVFLVGDAPSGVFAGKAHNIAARVEGEWVFYAPVRGWQAMVGLAPYIFDGNAWQLARADDSDSLAGTRSDVMATPNGVRLFTEQFGWGATSLPITADLNAVNAGADRCVPFVFSDSTLNLPPGSNSGGRGIQIAEGNKFTSQVVWMINGGVMFSRVRHGQDTWAEWQASVVPALTASLGLDDRKGVTALGVKTFIEQYGFTASFMSNKDDLNSVSGMTDRTVVFAFRADSKNIPVAGVAGRGIAFASGSGNTTQIVWLSGTGKMYVRERVRSTWGAWISALMSSEVGTDPGMIPTMTEFGLNDTGLAGSGMTIREDDAAFLLRLRSAVTGTIRNDNPNIYSHRYSAGLIVRTGDTFFYFCPDYSGTGVRVVAGNNSSRLYSYDLWTTRNTTVDTNNFIKKASPIARLTDDPDAMQSDFIVDGLHALAGHVSVNDEAEGVSARKVSTGVYVVTGSVGMAKEGWTVEVPQDVNGNRLCHVTVSETPDGVITVSVAKRKFDVDTAMVVAGEPMDIPAGRWVDLRLVMPEDSAWNIRQKDEVDEDVPPEDEVKE